MQGFSQSIRQWGVPLDLCSGGEGDEDDKDEDEAGVAG